MVVEEEEGECGWACANGNPSYLRVVVVVVVGKGFFFLRDVKEK